MFILTDLNHLGAGPQPVGGAIGQLPPPKFKNTYVFVRYSNRLHHFAPPDNISWLRPCLGATHFSTLRDPYFGNRCFTSKYSTPPKFQGWPRNCHSVSWFSFCCCNQGWGVGTLEWCRMAGARNLDGGAGV